MESKKVCVGVVGSVGGVRKGALGRVRKGMCGVC